MPYSKDELEAMKKAQLVAAIRKLESEITALGKQTTADAETISNLNNQVSVLEEEMNQYSDLALQITELEPEATNLEEFIACYKKLKEATRQDANYEAYGQTGLTESEYEALLRDKSM